MVNEPGDLLGTSPGVWEELAGLWDCKRLTGCELCSPAAHAGPELSRKLTRKLARAAPGYKSPARLHFCIRSQLSGSLSLQTAFSSQAPIQLTP